MKISSVLALIAMISILVIFGYLSIYKQSDNILLMVIGALISILSQIVSYYFGSSKSSSDKSSIIDNLGKKLMAPTDDKGPQ